MSGNGGPDTKKILFTVDVEDWFQVENFKDYIPFSTWNLRELRVEKNVYRLLDIIDTHREKRHDRKLSVTFFTLGWVADRFPHMVREIIKRGHEVASHGDNHHLCTKLASDALIRDLKDSKAKLEDIAGEEIAGYRAPSFAINNDILKLIEDSGYSYDSSFNSFDGHGRYGKVDLSGSVKNGVAYRISSSFYELPVGNLKFGRYTVPLGGGGYFRLFPFSFFKRGIRSILNSSGGYVFYLHPWEIDPDQPRVDDASAFFKFRHYVNLNKTERKISLLFDSFSDCSFVSAREYCDELRFNK